MMTILMCIILVLCFQTPLAASVSSNRKSISNPLVLLVGVSEYDDPALRALPGVQEEMYHLYQLFSFDCKYHVRCSFGYDEAYAEKNKKMPKMSLTFKALTDFLDSSYKIYQKVKDYDGLIFVFSGHGCVSNHGNPMILLSNSKFTSNGELVNSEYFDHIKNKFCSIIRSDARKKFIDKPEIFFNLSCQTSIENVKYPPYRPFFATKVQKKTMLAQKQYEIDETKFLKNVFTIASALKGKSTGTRLGVTVTKLLREATRKHQKSLHGIVNYIHKNAGNSSCMFNIQPSFGADKIFFVKNLSIIRKTFDRVLIATGFYLEAKTYYEKKLAIQEQNHGVGHFNTAGTMFDLGCLLHFDLGEYTEAEAYYKKVLAIQENSNISYATMHNLGNLLNNIGRYKEAKTYLEKALKIQRSDWTLTACTMHELGNVHRNLCEYTEAKKYLEKALKIYTYHCGADHSYTAMVMQSLGNALNNVGEYEDAKHYYEKALKIRENHYGATHIKTAVTMGNLGDVFDSLGEYAEAKEYLEKALKIREKHYGATHLETTITRGNLGFACGKLKEYKKAKECYKQNIKIFTKHYGANHAETKAAKKKLARLDK